MSELVDSAAIEQIVGTSRHKYKHYGLAVSEEKNVYILHSYLCLQMEDDLRDCRYSQALDEGIDLERWSGFEDRPVILAVELGELVPDPENRHHHHATVDEVIVFHSGVDNDKPDYLFKGWTAPEDPCTCTLADPFK